MPILKKSILRMQQEGVLDGQLRIGTSNPGKNGGKSPVKLTTWRMTSPSRKAIETAAAKFGGEARPWASDRGPQWEVVTPLPELPVQFGGGAVVDQWMTYFEKGVCLRRCTGADDATDEMTGNPCECNASGRELCKPETKLRVRFFDLPGIGWWRFTSRGKFVAAGFPERAAFLRSMADRDVYVPARLVLREMVLPGKRFPVVDIDIDVSVAQILTGDGVGTMHEIAAGRQPLALPAGERTALPVTPPATAVVAATVPAPAAVPPNDEPPSVRAQRYADAALKADRLDGKGGLRDLTSWAGKSELLDEYVSTSTDAPESLLRDVLEDAMEQLTQRLVGAEAAAT